MLVGFPDVCRSWCVWGWLGGGLRGEGRRGRMTLKLVAVLLASAGVVGVVSLWRSFRGAGSVRMGVWFAGCAVCAVAGWVMLSVSG